jgi:hypothetical protein
MPTTGWRPVGALPNDTVFVSNIDSIQIYLDDTAKLTGLIRVRAVSNCGAGLPFGRTFQIGRKLIASDSIRRPSNQPDPMCAGSTRIYTAGTVAGATGYLWTLPGANWSAPSLTTTPSSIFLTAGAGAGGILTVQAINACGPGAPKTLVLPAVLLGPPATQTITDLQATSTLTVPRQQYATYQWQFNGANIPGATDTAYNYGSRSGNYSLVISLCNTTTTVGPLTSIGSAFAASSVDIFPNPTNGKLTVRSTSEKEVKVRILDLLGRTVVAERTTEGATLDFDLSGLSNGLYTVELNDGNARVQKKITKQ